MPAYLVYFLRRSDEYDEAPQGETEDDIRNQDGNNFGSLNYHLSGGYDKAGLDEFNLSKFRLFTPAQGHAVAHFLQLEAERSDAWEIEFAQIESECETDEEFEIWKANNARREAEKLARMSPEQLEAMEQREREQERWRAQHDSPDNNARYALERYWSRFL